MELHPILEKGNHPNSKLWYVISALGDCPSVRVGHTCTFIAGGADSDDKIYVIGGANPSGPFAETYVLNLATFSWDTIDHPGFRARYEHAAFVPKSQPRKIYVFGGADQGGNLNDIQILDTETKTWVTLSASGTPPSPRTYHMTTCIGDRFIVYSGGHQGSEPVGDRQVHCFNAQNHSWSTLNVRGDSPKPRHGHITAGIGNKVYFYGGMSGSTFYDDLHILDLDNCCWKSVKQKKGHPAARAAHSSCIVAEDVYVFGGMNRDGALDDTWKLDTVTNKWSRVEVEGPAPACRLDFSMCAITLSIPSMTADSVQDLNASRNQAKDALDQQLRMGSAGSVRSLGSGGSAGSQRSAASTCSLREERLASSPSSPAQGSPQHQGPTAGENRTSGSPAGSSSMASSPTPAEPREEGAVGGMGVEAASASAAGVAVDLNKTTISMVLIMGGMDTEGEIFDDTLAMRISDVQQ